MTQISYTPLGGMIHPVDIYDPGTELNPDGTQPAPTLVFSGLYCKVEGLLLNSEARKLAQQIVTEATHWITTVYPKDPSNPLLCAITSRMFIMFRGRKMTIERVIDPDENQVEIRMLCVERNDGR
jgi:SPP1 family predicted phage head-tail adaptor